jgi:hypothetical protein
MVTMMLIALALATGVALGVRYTVFVLVPASCLGLAFEIAVGAAHQSGAWTSGLTVVFALTSLQVGYLIGSALLSFSLRKRVRDADRNASGITTHSLVL